VAAVESAKGIVNTEKNTLYILIKQNSRRYILYGHNCKKEKHIALNIFQQEKSRVKKREAVRRSCKKREENSSI